jgi:hypothetical protein
MRVKYIGPDDNLHIDGRGVKNGEEFEGALAASFAGRGDFVEVADKPKKKTTKKAKETEGAK